MNDGVLTMRVRNVLIMAGLIMAAALLGCGGKDDAVNENPIQETESEEQKTTESAPDGVIKYTKEYLLNKPDYVEKGSDILLDSYDYDRKTDTHSISLYLGDIKICNSIYDISDFAGYDESEFLDYIKVRYDKNYVGSVYKLQDDGSIIFGENVETDIILSKQKYTNMSDETIKFNMYESDAVAMVDEDKYNYYNLDIGTKIITDKISTLKQNGGLYSLQAGESVETVMVYIVPALHIDVVKIENNKLTATKMSDYDYDKMCLKFRRYLSESNIDNECFVKIWDGVVN